ncbi:MAG: transcription termination/antitermination protein NusA [Chloroflexota bacterium]|nr:MAG: transcription termination/antitermination protein NusA [Chloroflexota bacterium]
MKSDFLLAIKQLCDEKSLPKEVIIEAVEAALISAYKRNFGTGQEITVKIVPTTGEFKVYAQKTVVEQVTDPRTEITMEEARRLRGDVALDDVVPVESTPNDFGRIAAQTAKQVVLQRLREAEREAVYEEFTDKEGEIISGVVQRVEPKQLVIDLGKAEAILPSTEQVPNERYRVGQRVKAYLMEVHRTSKGPQLIVSRTHKNLLRRLLELEVPEIYNGLVEIKSIAREAGSRSKAAVSARQERIDPVGSCVGLRGIRIQNIVNELNGEKIDVVHWNPDPGIFVANALSPAQVLSVEIDEDEKTATVVVPDRQLSLAIGKEGQNARLAAKLTGWRVDIKSQTTAKAEAVEKAARREAELSRLAEVAAAQAAETAVAAELTRAEEAGALSVAAPEAEVVSSEVVQPAEVVAPPVAEMPALEAEATPVEAEIVPPVEPIEEVVPEAVLAEAMLAQEAPAVPTGPEAPAVITELPPLEAVERPQQIRFAEELLATSSEARGKKTKGKRERDEKDVPAKAKKPRKIRPAFEEEDEEDEYGGFKWTGR